MFFIAVKRAVRVLLSEEYKKKQSKVNSKLPPVASEEQALQVLKLFPLNRLGFQVIKLDTDDALKVNMKPRPGVPCLRISPQQNLESDSYVVWFYEPFQISTYLYAGGALAGIFAVVLFPLWPLAMRRGVWYLSMGALGLIGAFFGLSIIRLILYLISSVMSPGLWIFPNLFEDLGVLDSFVPFYAWQGEDAMKIHRLKNKKKKSKKQKERKRLKQEAEAEALKNGTPSAPAGGVPGIPLAGPGFPGGQSIPIGPGAPGGPGAQGPTNPIQAAAQAQLMRQFQLINAQVQAEQKKRQEAGNPMTPVELSKYGQGLLEEYSRKLRENGGPSIKIVPSGGAPPGAAQPVQPSKRIVELEDVEDEN